MRTNRYFEAIDLDALRTIHGPADRAPLDAGPARRVVPPSAAELREEYGDARVGYTTTQVADITDVSTGQLDYWTSSGLVTASVRERDPARGLARLYSFPDMVRVKTIKSLVNGGVTVQRVRAALAAADRDGLDLANCTLATDGHSVYALQSRDEVIDLLGSGQTVIAVALEVLTTQLALATRNSGERPQVTELAGCVDEPAGEVDRHLHAV